MASAICVRPWPALLHHMPEAASISLRPSTVKWCISLAPASSRGFFLNARLAVNGIQCAARSFGTLTAGRAGLLSSIGCLFGFGLQGFARHAISFAWLRERTMPRIIAGQRGGFRDSARLAVAAVRW